MKKQTITSLKNKLWEHCKRIIRKKYEVGTNQWICFTCDRFIDEPAKAQTSHFIPSGSCGAYLRYDLRNLRVACYHCNINLGGNGAEYYVRLVKEMGQEHVDKIFQDKNISVKADVLWYSRKIEEYSKM